MRASAHIHVTIDRWSCFVSAGSPVRDSVDRVGERCERVVTQLDAIG
jgi:hypothetical protein